ncbi:hypothetical protein OAC90_01185 [Planktomarina sp.]|nr:hypothetical protein [Planktomarina sp.]
MVECTQGGYDGRFDRGENTKAEFETRTLADHWQPDVSLYSLKINTDEINLINCPNLRAVAIQEIEARLRRKHYKRLTQPTNFSDDHWSY